ncbi:MAG: ACT domain-containing protein [Propionibacteriaceae bacterium]|nr:ACT domain-containing protein [Propionibacteriaceae bacterium]
MRLTVLPGEHAVCRLGSRLVALPEPGGGLVSLSVTDGEVSLVCPADQAPDGARVERGWRVLRVEGPLDFGLVGVLADLSGALARAGLSVFVVSTFDTDYLLVFQLAEAVAALRQDGHTVATGVARDAD